MKRSDVCVAAIADCFRGEADILCNPIGISPVIGGRLAKATFSPDVVMTDAVSVFATNPLPINDPDAPRVVESYAPYRTIFDILWAGKRHVMMGATQIDLFGNQNIAAIGDYRQPKTQLLGLRGAPGNLINHRTSFWVPKHSTRSFVSSVDIVSGPGYDRMRTLGAPANRFHDVYRIVSNLGVFDFETPDQRMRLRSIHPGVEIDTLLESTDFDLVVPTGVEVTRTPTDEEIEIMNMLDPKGLRHLEVPE
ncbi:MAG: CoA-transferase [Acidimicrobiales bacterium]|jgi:acyl CoA:acetate/3-ketoacid CoA transferase beta subunit|nr:CoA-transferase [Acidimicrobiales bacterium]